MDVDDANDEDITEHLKKCKEILDDYVGAKGQNVLVHCVQGKSRSVSIVIYYLMTKHGWNVNETLKYIKNLRSIAGPNEGFMQQLN